LTVDQLMSLLCCTNPIVEGGVGVQLTFLVK
jgi:hypothetical protein